LQSYFFRAIMRLAKTQLNDQHSVHQMRAFNATGERLASPPRGATITRFQIDDVAGEWITAAGVKSDAVMLYLHGGGFILGWTNRYRVMLANLSRACDQRMLGLDYALAPEHPFPEALEQSLAAYRWLLRETPPERIVIGGDSAGANLTLTMLLTLRDAGDPLPAAAVCISPPTDMTMSGASYHSNARIDPVLSLSFVTAARRYYTDGQDLRNPLISPLFGDLHGLPPILIHAASDEVLLSDAEAFTARAREAGVAVQLKVWPGMWHDFHTFVPALPEAKEAVNEIGQFVRGHVTSTPLSVPTT
jgi:acetyl esterase/lipase